MISEKADHIYKLWAKCETYIFKSYCPGKKYWYKTREKRRGYDKFSQNKTLHWKLSFENLRTCRKAGNKMVSAFLKYHSSGTDIYKKLFWSQKFHNSERLLIRK